MLEDDTLSTDNGAATEGTADAVSNPQSETVQPSAPQYVTLDEVRRLVQETNAEWERRFGETNAQWEERLRKQQSGQDRAIAKARGAKKNVMDIAPLLQKRGLDSDAIDQLATEAFNDTLQAEGTNTEPETEFVPSVLTAPVTTPSETVAKEDALKAVLQGLEDFGIDPDSPEGAGLIAKYGKAFPRADAKQVNRNFLLALADADKSTRTRKERETAAKQAAGAVKETGETGRFLPGGGAAPLGEAGIIAQLAQLSRQLERTPVGEARQDLIQQRAALAAKLEGLARK